MNIRSNIIKANRNQLILFWSILILSFLIRIVGLENIPAGINQDEAMGAMDAWALSQYGTDRFGTQLPVHFAAWGESQMSVLLSYCMVPFIKLFGFSTFIVRLPMALASVMGIVLMYHISKRFFSVNMSLAIMAFTAVNPWHFMQSRWSIDCNLFPHVFLLGFFLLLKGFEKRRYLYLSMVFFGLTFYCYGIAVYTVPAFLFVYAAWCLWQKEFTFKEILISICIFFVMALPEILVMAINMFGLGTIRTPLITMPYFSDSVRGNDILFLNFSFYQLGRNALSMLKQAFLQYPDHLFNTLPRFGALYYLSTPFTFFGIIMFAKRFFTEKNIRQKTLDLALCGFLIMGIWAGLITYEVNVNRINIIFYPLIILTVYGIYCFIQLIPKFTVYLRNGFIIAYTILAVFFFSQYFTYFAENIQTMFNVDFLSLVKEADDLEDYDTLYISSDMGWQTNKKMAEILTQYACKIDALYYQERINETGGRELLPYSERYHFMDIVSESSFDKDALYVLHENDLDHFTDTAYEVILMQGSFIAIELQ